MCPGKFLTYLYFIRKSLGGQEVQLFWNFFAREKREEMGECRITDIQVEFDSNYLVTLATPLLVVFLFSFSEFLFSFEHV
jgi:hypothetical protein